jgi:hypothetical protein
VLDEAHALRQFADHVVIVPKACQLAEGLSERIPRCFTLGYSVPSRYGGTPIPVSSFEGRAVHLLGGRPDLQRRLAERLPVVSMDGNRFTLDARYGDYFDGETFRPHPRGGYVTCLRASIRSISRLWERYRVPKQYRLNHPKC